MIEIIQLKLESRTSISVPQRGEFRLLQHGPRRWTRGRSPIDVACNTKPAYQEPFSYLKTPTPTDMGEMGCQHRRWELYISYISFPPAGRRRNPTLCFWDLCWRSTAFSDILKKYQASLGSTELKERPSIHASQRLEVLEHWKLECDGNIQCALALGTIQPFPFLLSLAIPRFPCRMSIFLFFMLFQTICGGDEHPRLLSFSIMDSRFLLSGT